ncbi:matrixin family metalloprotease [Cellulomonas soli]|uniref:Uncharacterized protein n=1 Tax=Cellulomonas soli TaxID=931535 RepID=A0A512PGI3_9CELL|nr:matrixin family metalloprotease [Cellulomonas soli]NYI58182.1 hypothetical protein [Cellulomonas soli]GEP70315.1 hypothetical protein CSO01_30300 [Cellulomonas soli]
MSDIGPGGGDPRFVWGAGPAAPFAPPAAQPTFLPPHGGPPAPRHGTVRVVVVSVLVGLLLAAFLSWRSGGPWGDPAPTAGREEAEQPLGVPPTVEQPNGSYTFMAVQDDGLTPVAYDPCRPVHYVVRAEGEPAGGRQMITEAFLRLSQTTGLVFVDDGETTETVLAERASFQPDLYGDRWAPVLVAWSDQGEVADLSGDVAGLGGSVPMRFGDGPAVYVTGQVVLDAPAFTQAMAVPGGGPVARAIVLHELAHVVGLGHVDDPAELMYPYAGRADLGAGDLTGLALLGAGACVPQL